MGRISIRLGKAPRIKMGPTFAVLMDFAAVGKQGTPQLVQCGEFVEYYIVEYGRKKVVGVGRTAGEVDDRLVLDNVPHTDRSGRVGTYGLDPAVTGTGSDCNDCRSSLGSLSQRFQRGLAAHFTVDAVVFSWNGAFDHQNVLAFIGSH